MNYLKINRVANYIPKTYYTNDDLKQFMDTSDEWITKRTGIKKRHIAHEESLFDMTKKSIENLNLSEKELQEIDGIILATMSYEDLSPGLSQLITSAFDFRKDIFCFDLNVACSGFIYALHTADCYIRSGFAKKILVIGAEKMSNILDFTDRGVSILFGDGVSSCLCVADKKEHILNPLFKVQGSREEINCSAIGEDNYLRMDGQAVFKFAVRAVNDCIESVNKEEIDYFLFHQANIRIIDKIIKDNQLDQKKVLVNIENYGNTSAASLPILFGENQEKFKENDKLLLVGFGAGLTYGRLEYIV